MSLSAREQHALDSIKDGLAGSDPELAALLSAFNRLASDEEMPDGEKIHAGSRLALGRLRRTRWRSGLRGVCQRLGFARAVLLLMATVALIVIALALTVGGHHGTCAETVTMVCARPAPGHSPGSPSHSTSTGQDPQQRVAGIPQAGP
jgi:hypothetical protein